VGEEGPTDPEIRFGFDFDPDDPAISSHTCLLPVLVGSVSNVKPVHLVEFAQCEQHSSIASTVTSSMMFLVSNSPACVAHCSAEAVSSIATKSEHIKLGNIVLVLMLFVHVSSCTFSEAS
jgi:hypothetical protein